MYIYKTKGICPPEIHFELSQNLISNVSFAGGGCRGNAQLISRLLEGQEVKNILPLLKGIRCRNNTSCPDQLFQAVQLALDGKLEAAGEIKVYEPFHVYQKVAVIAELDGDIKALETLLHQPVEAIICLGNLTGPGGENDRIVELAVKENVIFTKGPFDITLPCTKTGNNVALSDAPFLTGFQLGQRKVVGFYSGYIQNLNGFSDFTRFALELLMVSNLSDYLRKEEVYPALETMTGQFQSDVVLFAYTGVWKHVKLGKVDFFNVGSVVEEKKYRYLLMAWENEKLKVETVDISM